MNNLHCDLLTDPFPDFPQPMFVCVPHLLWASSIIFRAFSIKFRAFPIKFRVELGVCVGGWGGRGGGEKSAASSNSATDPWRKRDVEGDFDILSFLELVTTKSRIGLRLLGFIV
jgi:hypothetical protein